MTLALLVVVVHRHDRHLHPCLSGVQENRERWRRFIRGKFRFGIWCPAVPDVVIPMVIQTTQLEPSEPNWTDDTPT